MRSHPPRYRADQRSVRGPAARDVSPASRLPPEQGRRDRVASHGERHRRVTQRSIYRPPWRIDVTIREGVDLPIPVSRLARAVAVALDAARAPAPASIGLILADDAELAGL